MAEWLANLLAGMWVWAIGGVVFAVLFGLPRWIRQHVDRARGRDFDRRGVYIRRSWQCQCRWERWRDGSWAMAVDPNCISGGRHLENEPKPDEDYVRRTTT